ncbi:MAG TPA: tetratricopeptide repeat protein [Pirellulales bacterium]|jgi:tetratricopeptide (TPR) repeat protein|nr:tetratricopeptide repeat protein [Pirellulales bacterium]
MRRLNIKLSASLVVGLLVMVVGVHVIHGIQIDKNADVLLKQAEAAQKEGTDGGKRRAVKRYSQYLKHRPTDVGAQEKFALLAADLADEPGATQEEMKLAYRALDVAATHPELVEVRRRIIDYYMRLGRFVDAIEYLKKLRDAAKANGTREPALDVKYARCEVVVGHETTAIEVLDELVGYNEKTKTFDADAAAAPGEIDAYLVLAEVLRRRRDDPDRANAVMQQMIVANPESSEAHLRLGRYDMRTARYEEAIEEFNRALALAPEDPDVILEVADIDITRKDFTRVGALLELGVKKYPTLGEMYRALGALDLAQGKPGAIDEAIKHVEAGLEQAPNSPTLMVFLVDLQLMKQDFEAASAAIERMRTARFTQEFIEFYEATLAVQQRKWALAVRQLEALRPRMARWPDRIEQIDLELGKCYENLGQPDRQAAAFRRVMDVDPKSVMARLGHSRALGALGKRKEGMEELQKVDRELRARKVVVPQVRANMLQSRITEQLQKPSDEREWEGVNALVEEMLADSDMSEIRKGLLQVEVAALKGDLDEAESLMKPLLKANPKDVHLWLSWFGIQERLRAQDRATTEKRTAADRQEAIHDSVEAMLADVAEAEKSAGDQVQFRVVRAAAAARLGGDDAKKKLAELEEGIDKFSVDDQMTLWEGLGNAYQRLNSHSGKTEPSHEDYEEVRRCYQKMVDRHPEDLFPWENMFDLAIMYHEQAAAKDFAEHIRKITGFGSPTYKYCAASQLIEQVIDRKVEVSRLEEARKLVDEALRVRPDWHQLYRLSGEIDDLQGHFDAAVKNYQRAQDLGSNNSATARRLVILLYRQGKMEDVQAAMKRVGRANLNPMLEKIDIESKFRTNDQETALKMAKESVAANPDDDTAHVFYGQLLDTEKPSDEAEQEFRAALKIKPDATPVWMLLINHLVKADRLAKADKNVAEKNGKKSGPSNQKEAGKTSGKKVAKKGAKGTDAAAETAADKTSGKLAEAAEAIVEAKKSIPEAVQDSFLAQAYEAIGDIPQAETHLLAWQKQEPDNINRKRIIATFYAGHGMPEKAREQIEAILTPKPGADDAAVVANQAWARRKLAEMLARQGSVADVQKAIQLVEKNNPDGRGASPPDLRLIAGILAKRPDAKSRERAIQLYEQLADQQMLDLRERMGLAVLYNRAGNWSKAREEMMSLWVRVPKNPAIIANLIQMLIEHNELQKIDNWLAKLEEAAPVAVQPAGNITVQLKARWLAKQEKTAEAIELVKGLVSDPITPEQLPRLGLIVGLLEELKDNADAEKYMGQWYEADPDQILSYAAFLGRQGKLDEAFALLETARDKQPLPNVCAAALEIVRFNSEKPATEPKKTLEEWLHQAIEAAPTGAESVRLQFLLVELQDLEERYDDSIKIYRALLAGSDLSEQQRAVVENNLAFMLITRGSGNNVAEAKGLIDKAVNHLGPVAGVLDTRGLIRLASGDAQEALADFKTAVTESPTAVNYFHLALAEEKLGNASGASDAFEKAEELKLDSKALSPTEKRDFKRLHKSSAKPGKG